MLKSKNHPKTTEITTKIMYELAAESFAHEEANMYGCYECGSMIRDNALNAINQAFKDAGLTLVDYFADLAARGLTYKTLYDAGILSILDGLVIPFDTEDRAIGEILKSMPTSFRQERPTDKEVPF